MTDPHDLIAQLRAQLDESERHALAWAEERRSWQHVGGRMLTYNEGIRQDVEAIDTTGRANLWYEQIYVKTTFPALAKHIAHNDPKATLERAERMRKILDWAEERIDRAEPLPPGGHEGRDPDEIERDEAVADAARFVLETLAGEHDE